MKTTVKIAATVLLMSAASTVVANATVRNVCNGGSCRTIVSDSSGVVWVSDLWIQH